jgi:hypothetical protein
LCNKPIIHRIGLPPQLKMLFVERHTRVDEYGWTEVGVDETGYYSRPDGKSRHEHGFWLLPISTNPDRTLGIFLRLYDDGKIERVTVREDEGDEIHVIKPADKDIK